MENLWAFLFQSIEASLTAAVLLVVKRLFLDKLSPRWQYGIWGVLAVRLLLPAGLGGRALLPPVRTALEMAKTAAESSLSSAFSHPFSLIRVYAPIPLFSPGLAPRSVTDWLFCLYAAGVAVCLLWYLFSYLRLRRAVSRGYAPEGDALERVATVCRKYDLPLPRRVRVCAWTSSAFVCGPLRPVLVLPRGEVDEKVILHELLHLKHGDVWAGVGMCLLRCLHWCNPLIGYCCNRAQNDCESLCDQRVLERLEGEERREYGRILLSMADDRYARAPGTSSMANGGQNIKARIAAIARFKRYPRGMALASLCVAALLCSACLAGVAPASATELSRTHPALALAQARLQRPTTPAGALDTYVKAVLTDNGGYLAMVTPASGLEDLARKLVDSTELHLGLNAPLEERDFPSWTEHWEQGWEESVRSYHAQWRVFNLLEGADGSYTGLLVLVDQNLGGSREEEAIYAVSQPVRLVREDGWTVEPLADWSALPGDVYPLYPTGDLPAVTYVGRAGGVQVELDYQYLLWVDNEISPTSSGLFSFSSSASTDFTLKPDAIFTGWYRSAGGRAYNLATGEEISLSVTYTPLLNGEALPYEDGTARLPSVAGKTSGTAGGRDAHGGPDMTQAPQAMELRFAYNGQMHTCTALPAEGGTR